MNPQSLRIIFVVMLPLFILSIDCKKDGGTIIPPDPPPPGEDTTANPRKLIDNAGYPDWSPTGERIAFVRNDSIRLWYFADKHEEFITTGTEPNFSPDGKKITFERDKKIYWIDVETKQETYLTDGITPNWSANGKWIAFANKTASRLLTDGTIIYGEPSPDSSIYYYDLDSNKINRVVITNYDSLYIGDKLSLFFPTWGMNDSILFFSSEIGIRQVKITGGIAVLFWFPLPNTTEGLSKKNKITAIGSSGQQRWNEATNRLVYWGLLNTGFNQYTPASMIYNFNTGFQDGGIYEATDPCWEPDGLRFCYHYQNSVWIYKP